MEQKGEFEQRPEVKPADQIPFSKPKASKLPWVLCIVFVLTTVGLSVFLVLGSMKKTKSENTGTNCVAAVGDTNEEEKKEETKPTTYGLTGHVEYSTIGVNYANAVFYFTSDGDVYARYANSKGEALTLKNDEGIGQRGDYTIPFSKLGEYGPDLGIDLNSEEGKNLTIKGAYKLDLKNEMYAFEMGEGQAKLSLTTAFVDVDGNMSVLAISSKDLFEYGETDSAKLYKNVEKNVASINLVDGRDYVYTLVHYRDGSQKRFDFDKLK